LPPAIGALLGSPRMWLSASSCMATREGWAEPALSCRSPEWAIGLTSKGKRPISGCTSHLIPDPPYPARTQQNPVRIFDRRRITHFHPDSQMLVRDMLPMTQAMVGFIPAVSLRRLAAPHALVCSSLEFVRLARLAGLVITSSSRSHC